MHQSDIFEVLLKPFAPGGRVYADTPRARKTDSEGSHAAADEVKRTGRLAAQQAQCLAAVREWPGRTSLELASRMSADRYMLARRLPELAAAGQIRKGETRTCSVGNRPAAEWWPEGNR